VFLVAKGAGLKLASLERSQF